MRSFKLLVYKAEKSVLEEVLYMGRLISIMTCVKFYYSMTRCMLFYNFVVYDRLKSM